MSEPLTLDEVKAHVRVTSADFDSMLTGLITEAREEIEKDTWRALVPKTRTLQLRSFPCGADPIVAPEPPLISVNSITYLDPSGDEQEYDVETLRLDTRHLPGTIEPAYGVTWPDTQDGPAAVLIEYECGYQATSDVPQALKQALLLIISQLFEHAEPSILSPAAGGTGSARTTLDRILEKYRIRDKRLLEFV